MKKCFKKILAFAMAISLLMLPTISLHALSNDDSAQVQNLDALVYSPSAFRILRTVYSNYASHYTINSARETALNGALITDQGNCPEFLIGEAQMADVGCEVAAVYNALKLRGKSSWYRSVSEIIRTFEQSGYIMNNGNYGTDPYAIGEYFDAQSIQNLKYTSYSDFKSRVTTAMRTSNQVYIVSFWNSETTIMDGLHTIAFYASKDLGTIFVYNNGNQTSVSSVEAIEDLTDVSFIVGYCVPKNSRSID